MIPLVLVLFFCGGLSASEDRVHYSIDNAKNYFTEFTTKYNKQYSSERERQERFEIFKKNLELLNAKYQYHYGENNIGITKFFDLTEKEFLSRRTGLKTSGMTEKCQLMYTTSYQMDVPKQFDWRKKNKVTPVKDQGNCRSCWAFATIGVIEGQYAIKYNQLRRFSEQQLVDCSRNNNACDNGILDAAVMWLKEYGGVASEQDYPYVERNDICYFNTSMAKVQIKECLAYNLTTPEELKEVLVNTGPVSVGVTVAYDWSWYAGGILTCGGLNLDHAVLIVGYGTENGTDYWIAKNSWGEDWGESGYVRLKMDNWSCGIFDPSHINIVSAEIF